MSRDARKALALAGLSIAAFGASTGSALADTASTKLLSCDFPIVGAALISANITTTLPTTIATATSTGTIKVNATATTQVDSDGLDVAFAGLDLVEANTVSGTGRAGSNVSAPGFNLDVGVKLTVPSSTKPAAPPLVIPATGAPIPAIKFPQPGEANVTVSTIDLNLTALLKNGTAITALADAQDAEAKYPDSDGLKTTFDAPCVLVDPTDKSVAKVTITGPVTPPPTTPAPVTPAPVTPAPVTPAPVTPAPVTPAPVTPAPVTPAPVTPTPTPKVTPAPVTPAPVTPAPVTPAPVTPAPATPTPGSTPKPVLYNYVAAGSATLKTLTKGTLPLKGKVDARLQLASGNFEADVALDQTTGNLIALGFLPVTAKVQIQSLTPATGNLNTTTGLTAAIKVRIKLPSVTLFGIQLAGGATCQAKDPSNINLKSPGFKALTGGTLTGVFSISDLTGCGGLNGLVSPLTSGSGNAIALTLSK